MTYDALPCVKVRFALTREGILDGARKGLIADRRTPGEVFELAWYEEDVGYDDLLAIAEPDGELVAHYGASPRVRLVRSTRDKVLDYEWARELTRDSVGSPPRIDSRQAVAQSFSSPDVYDVGSEAEMRIVEPLDFWPTTEQVERWAGDYRGIEAALRAELESEFQSALLEWRDNALDRIANARRAIKSTLADLDRFSETYGRLPLDADSDLALLPSFLADDRDPQLRMLEELGDLTTKAVEIRAAVMGALYECAALDMALESEYHREGLMEKALQWVENYGSKHLRRLVDHSRGDLGPHWNKYVDERLDSEHPEWHRVKKAPIKLEEAASPTPSGFDHLDSAREDLPGAYLAYGRVKDRGGGGFAAAVSFCGESIFLPDASLKETLDAYYAEEPF